MGFVNALFGEPWYGGSLVSNEVPGKWDVALDGRGFMLAKGDDALVRQSIALLRQQADSGDRPAERSINPEDFWRRAAESWHWGSGQSRFDREGLSSPWRYHTSKGVDPSTKFELSLLPATVRAFTSANTNLWAVPAGSRFYWTDGNSLKFSTDLTAAVPASTTVTGTPAVAPSSIASDGKHVWIAVAGSGVYQTDTGSGAATQLVTSAVSATAVVGFVKGRLMVATGPSLYNVTSTAPAVLPAALFTSNNDGFTWVGFAEGPAFIYAAGFAGDKSLLYKITIKTDGTALDAPVVAGELPDGEIVRSITGYLGFLMVGTDKGVRFCVLDNAGNVILGPLIPTASAVQCFEPQDRFVWYGLTNYDTTSTGLGRLDLLTDVGEASVPTPAFWSDLMATAQGAVQAAATFQNRRVFTVSGSGVWVQDTNLVASGSVESGTIGFGLPDDKIAMQLDVRHEPLDGSVAGAVAVDSEDYATVGVGTSAGSTAELHPIGQRKGTDFRVRITMTRDTGDATAGPVLTRWTLLANPAPRRRERLVLRVRLGERPVSSVNAITSRSPREDLDFIRRLWQSQNAVRCQARGYSTVVTVDGWDMGHDTEQENGDYWNGDCQLNLKVLE